MSDEANNKIGWTARKGKIGADTGFDRAYWLSRSPQERGNAVWDLTVLAWEMKGIDITQLRLDRAAPPTKRRLR